MRLMPSTFSALPATPDRLGRDRRDGAPAGAARPRRVHAAQLLPEGRLHRVEAVSGTTVTCVTGRLWVTLAGDGDDHLLSPGETFTAPAPGLMLAQALATSTFTVDDLPAATPRI